MKRILSGFIYVTAKIIGRKNLEKILIYSAKAIKVNLHIHGLVQIGAVNGFISEVNGEHFFLEEILPELLDKKDNNTFFDVGANVGNYALSLKKYFQDAVIYSFEPVKQTFDALVRNTNNTDIKLFNIGFGSTTGSGELYNTVNGDNSEIASIYKDAFDEIHQIEGDTVIIPFEIDTLDNFCEKNRIINIDFLKIDVEGHEFPVLEGARKTISQNHIKIIQFEFNTHNAYSRFFLRDFYKILPDFNFYRLNKNNIVLLGDYNPVNEIFTAQNLLAIHKTISPKINSKHILSL
ncbi:FkbM family methyltransferase [Mucilaginibacter sp. UR6-11]|uniref:FkbM family methyltransferase n=1 Tax=Mucilaginibacter sp. UR6-11 TaxID=1435644 RepID=UPI001E617E18|nr:FkbM family methyltransferase [Mucilaginibacter sp. UR6-11]MCC8427007.1 FkbM family methyltransferase [Mucilaginibacter sp. UR6-11]